ncbi:DUF2073 domain-containing protein [Candidatus Woesearchaeota archaeon]|nr:DUF2073 domain-containing protein [Candidatus Woesearchaeota archaeon]
MVTLQFVPYTEIESLSSIGRIRKLLNITKQNKIVLLQGRLRSDEEAELIKTTMEEINKDFTGIELAVISPHRDTTGVKKLKYNVMNMVLGDRQGLTIIGPASLVKQIKKDPHKIELFMDQKKIRKKGKR